MKKVVLMLFLLSLASVAFAETPLGPYAFNGQATCMASPSGFNANLTPKGATYLQTWNNQGVTTFDANGTATTKGTSTVVDFGTQAVSTISYQMSYTWTESSGVISSTLVPGSYKGTFTGGPYKGATYTDSNFAWTGGISLDGKEIVVSMKPNVLTLKVYAGSTLVSTIPRICQWALNLVQQ